MLVGVVEWTFGFTHTGAPDGVTWSVTALPHLGQA
jgi:hypothetical protein